MAYDYNYFLKAQEENSKKYLNDQLALINASAAKQDAAAKTLYEGKIADVDSQYADEERRIAVQKFINEQEVEETMANMGLTDSGLNRTQQTAIQLSANNNMAKLQRQKQNMVDSLMREMTAALSDIETSRLSSESTLRQSVNSSNISAAQSAYKSYLDQQEAIEKERIKAEKERLEKQQEEEAKKNIIYTYMGDVTGEDGSATGKKYLDSDGNVRTFGTGINPYTGINNTAGASAKAYGTYSNGYQPKGIIEGNIDYGKLKDAGISTEMTGKKQQVRKTTSGNTVKYWVWYGKENAYIEVKLSDKPDADGNYSITPTNHFVYV